MMAEVAVCAVGVDRPGIVAGVSQVLLRADCNIEDSSMTILRGHFAMMLIVHTPPTLTASQLEAEMDEVARDFDLVVSVRQVGDALDAGLGPRLDAASGPGHPLAEVGDPGVARLWTVAVHGGDRLGIVAAVSDCLAGLGVNILGLQTRLIGEASAAVYVMTLDIDLPDELESEGLRSSLSECSQRLGVTYTMHPSDADVL